jgi:hypothetical protein
VGRPGPGPMPRRVQVRYEQAVYGSFPFWDRGYAVLAHSPGCGPEWLAALRTACQRYGEPPAGAAEAPALFAMPLERGPWLIVGVSPQGHDDRGRPGALAFHALFLDPRDYRRAGCDPFVFAKVLRSDWTVETCALPAGAVMVQPREPAGPAAGRASGIAAVLSRGRRVAIQAPAPIDTLARDAWLALPLSVRSRVSMATWAFGNGNRFDLVALPRLAGAELDESYIDPAEIDAEAGPKRGPSGTTERRLRRALPYLGAAALLIGAGLGLALRHDNTPTVPEPPTTAAAVIDQPPSLSAYRTGPTDPDERLRVSEALVGLAERFGVLDVLGPDHDDPVALMTALAGRLRYHGPWLSASERAQLEAEAGSSGGDSALALRWHAQVRRFATDRPLPEGFARGPLGWQLDTLAWSFHLDDDASAHRSPAEVPHALADALAVDVSLRDTRLTAQYPALAAYREFLARLPRR